MKRSAIASVENIEGRVEDSRSVQVLPEIFSRQEVEQLVFLPGAADIAAKELARVGIVLATRHGSTAGRFVPKVAEQLSVKIAGARLGYHVHRARRCQPRGKRQQRLLHPDFLDGAHWKIHCGRAHGFVCDIEPIHLHPGSATVAADHRGRREPSLRRGQDLTVEQLHSGFKPGQIEESAIGRNLFHLVAFDRAAYFRCFRIDQFGRRRDHAGQLDVTSGGRRSLDSDQKFGRLKPLRLYVQDVLSGRQVADGVGASRTGGGVSGLPGDLIGDREIGATHRGASRPGHSS